MTKLKYAIKNNDQLCNLPFQKSKWNSIDRC